ncbi:MAG TPA: hypothetical protein VK638_29655 [Edaphobacter sp.]|nr:hypothetical protein [Edaphobacter sp.]
MGQKTLHTRSLPLVTRGKTQRAAAAELALSRIAAREAILKPHLDILNALNQNASEQELSTLRFCSYLLQNSSLEKLESVEIVANWYRDRTETALIASA